MYTNLYKRSIPHTEQNLIYFSKQQKTPIKLLTPKTKQQQTQQRISQPHYHNEIGLIGRNNYKKNGGQNMKSCI